MVTASPILVTSDSLLICCACGAQYEVDASSNKTSCRICDDPRQYVPPSGQRFTTAQALREKHSNKIEPCPLNSSVYEIWTEPKFGIGQRACLIRTPAGNVLWDLVALLDQETVDRITELGGVHCIVISHPHFYTTWHDWSATFRCPVYMSKIDSVWANRTRSRVATLKLLEEQCTTILPGVTAAICGGHFDGSLVLHSEHQKALFVADAILAVPSAFNPDPAKPGVSTYAFLWSIPNAIPLSPEQILRIWRTLKKFEFVSTYGVFAKISNVKQSTEHRMTLKQRVLESAKITVRRTGYQEHALLEESSN
jgi:glyoxylase-like metal-dependent hydrolase (beta-lactamase superfamily II)